MVKHADTRIERLNKILQRMKTLAEFINQHPRANYHESGINRDSGDDWLQPLRHVLAIMYWYVESTNDEGRYVKKQNIFQVTQSMMDNGLFPFNDYLWNQKGGNSEQHHTTVTALIRHCLKEIFPMSIFSNESQKFLEDVFAGCGATASQQFHTCIANRRTGPFKWYGITYEKLRASFVNIPITTTCKALNAELVKLKTAFIIIAYIFHRKPDLLQRTNWEIFGKLGLESLEEVKLGLLAPHQEHAVRLLQPSSPLHYSMLVHRTGAGKTRQICALAQLYRNQGFPVFICVTNETTRVQTYGEMWTMCNNHTEYDFFPPPLLAKKPDQTDTDTWEQDSRGKYIKYPDRWDEALQKNNILVKLYSEFSDLCEGTTRHGRFYRGLRPFSTRTALNTDRVFYIFDESQTMFNHKLSEVTITSQMRQILAKLKRVCWVSATPFGEKEHDCTSTKHRMEFFPQKCYTNTYLSLFKSAPKQLNRVLLVYNGDVDNFRSECIYMDATAKEGSTYKEARVKEIKELKEEGEQDYKGQELVEYLKKVQDADMYWTAYAEFVDGDNPDTVVPLFYPKVLQYLDAPESGNVLIVSCRHSGVYAYHRLLSEALKKSDKYTYLEAGCSRADRSDNNVLSADRSNVLVQLYHHPLNLTYDQSSKKKLCLLLNELTDAAGINLKGFTTVIITTIYPAVSYYVQTLGRINRMLDNYVPKESKVNRVIIMSPSLTDNKIARDHVKSMVDELGTMIKKQKTLSEQSVAESQYTGAAPVMSKITTNLGGCIDVTHKKLGGQ
jgi:hypothetical protein